MYANNILCLFSFFFKLHFTYIIFQKFKICATPAKNRPLDVAKKMWKRIPHISAMALGLEEKVQKQITCLVPIFDISFPKVFKIKT